MRSGTQKPTPKRNLSGIKNPPARKLSGIKNPRTRNLRTSNVLECSCFSEFQRRSGDTFGAFRPIHLVKTCQSSISVNELAPSPSVRRNYRQVQAPKLPLTNTTNTATYLFRSVLRESCGLLTHAAVAANSSARLAFVSKPTDAAKISVKTPSRPNRMPGVCSKYSATIDPTNNSAARKTLVDAISRSTCRSRKWKTLPHDEG
jgi:hypothetical protein